MTELIRQEVLRIAKVCFHGKQYEAVTYESGPYDIDCPTNDLMRFAAAIYEAGAKSERAVSDRLLDALKRVVGDHNAPDDCYATGPLTGNPYQDLVACPSCQAESIIAEVEAMRKEKPE